MPYTLDYQIFPRCPYEANEPSVVLECAKEICEKMFNVIQEIAETDCVNGYCVDTYETSRKMRKIAKDALTDYGIYVDRKHH